MPLASHPDDLALAGDPYDPAAPDVTRPAGPLADLRLRWPATLGLRAWVSGLSVTADRVTAVVSTAAGPVAALAAPRSAAGGPPVPVTPLADGVSGWWAVGGWASPPVSWAGGATTGLLSLRAARPFRPAGVGRLWAARGAAPLTGVVDLAPAGPLAVGPAVRRVAGSLKPVARFALADPGGVPADPRQSVLATFAGPCGGRPAAGTCPDPQPVETVAGVGPDCDGVLTLVLAGCLSGDPAPGGGLALSPGVGRPPDGACPDRPPYRPDPAGQYADPWLYDATLSYWPLWGTPEALLLQNVPALGYAGVVLGVRPAGSDGAIGYVDTLAGTAPLEVEFSVSRAAAVERLTPGDGRLVVPPPADALPDGQTWRLRVTYLTPGTYQARWFCHDTTQPGVPPAAEEPGYMGFRGAVSAPVTVEVTL